MDPKQKMINRTYTLHPKVLDKLEDIYIKHTINREKTSRSSVVAKAIEDLWVKEQAS